MRLHALIKSVCRAAVFMCLLVLSVACQQAYLIPDEKAEEYSRGKNEPTEESTDSTTVIPNFDVNEWDDDINVEFDFGGEEQKGGGE